MELLKEMWPVFIALLGYAGALCFVRGSLKEVGKLVSAVFMATISGLVLERWLGMAAGISATAVVAGFTTLVVAWSLFEKETEKAKDAELSETQAMQSFNAKVACNKALEKRHELYEMNLAHYTSPSLWKTNWLAPIEEKTVQALKKLPFVSQVSPDCPLEDLNVVRIASTKSFYDMLQNAFEVAAEFVDTKKEDGANMRLWRDLTDSSKKLDQASPTTASFELGIEDIFNNRSVGITETDTGADLLLIVAGQSLLGKTGLRLIWLQAKCAPEGKPLELNYWRAVQSKNGKGDGLRQAKALKRGHTPEKGSFSAYVQYVYDQHLPTSIALSVEYILTDPVTTEKDCRADLAASGVRAQELITHFATEEKYGVFANANAAVESIKSNVGKSTKVLCVVDRSDGTSNNLVKEVQKMLLNKAVEQAPHMNRSFGRNFEGGGMGM